MSVFFTNTHKFFYGVIFCCFSLLFAENDSNSNGFVPPDDGVIAFDTPNGYDVLRISGDTIQTLLSIVTESSDENFIIRVYPYKRIEKNQLKLLNGTERRGLNKKRCVVLSQGALCCKIELFEDSYNFSYQYWKKTGSSNRTVFPINLNGDGGVFVVSDDTNSYLDIIIPFMTPLQKEKWEERQQAKRKK